ncbi:hypothetical protein BKA69DRAFT_1038147 [Paraphysoderma sedebokerense]|nr:hypothetical protein BKA69DRAFT_1038147 [Paraphysoderma sedebokerense]
MTLARLFQDHDLLLYFVGNFVHPFRFKTVRLINSFCNRVISENKHTLIQHSPYLLHPPFLGKLFIRRQFSESFVRFLHSHTKLNWSLLSRHQILSESFIDEFRDYVDWDMISQYQPISEDFIRRHEHLVNWLLIGENLGLSDAFVHEFFHKQSWIFIDAMKADIEYQMQKYRQYGEIEADRDWNWEYLSRHEDLPEDYIKRFHRRLDWDMLSRYQPLSENIITKFLNEIHWDCLVRNPNVDRDVLDRFSEFLGDENGEWTWKEYCDFFGRESK